MNTTLFKSTWAVTAAVIAAAMLVWLYLTGAAAGARSGSDPALVLWSGWITFGLMLLVCLYSLRKYMHKLGISPEFRWKSSLEALEAAEYTMNELRGRIQAGILTDRKEVEDIVNQRLAEHGVRRVCRADVRETGGYPPLLIRVQPTEPFGRMAKWLHFHVYVGLASGVTLWVHGGASMASTIGAAMNLLAGLVIVTGMLGIVLFALGPRWMIRRERDLCFEEAYVRERSLSKKLKSALADIEPEQARIIRSADKKGIHPRQAMAALQQAVALAPEDRSDLEDVMVLAAQRRRILSELEGLRRIKRYINFWRVVHVPGSILLLGLTLVHIWSVWRW